MSRVVIILGAGASKQAGAPLMNDFIAKAQDLLLARKCDASVAADFELVFKAIGQLHAANTKSQLNVRNVESVWSAFEMAKQIGRLGQLTGEDAEKPFRAIRSVILETLERSVRYPMEGKEHEKYPRPPLPYDKFGAFVAGLLKKGVAVSIISFNYDLCAEFALSANRIGYDYCLKTEARCDVPLLKLHGSLNWIYDQETGVQSVSFEEILRKFQFVFSDGPHVFLRISTALSAVLGEKNINAATATVPFIVPPSLSKTEEHSKILPVWRRACEELRTAQNILVFGYSLPENDNFFRYLYSLGTISDMGLKRFWVFDPSKNEVEKRYVRMLGQYALDCFAVYGMTFEQALDHLHELQNKEDLDL